MNENIGGRTRSFGARRFKFALVIALLVLLLIVGWQALRPHLSNAYVAPVIRLHVVPHSDSAADQRLKLSVRDALLPLVEAILADIESDEAGAERLAAHGKTLRAVALAELRRLESDYPVAIVTEVNDVGEPAALRVVIGNGRGGNWFCVLAPPLCFADLEPVERLPVDADDPAGNGGLRFAWKWLDKWFGGSSAPVKGVRNVDQDDVHADLAHTAPRDGDVGATAE